MYETKNNVRYTWSDTHITRYKKVSRLAFTMDMIYWYDVLHATPSKYSLSDGYFHVFQHDYNFWKYFLNNLGEMTFTGFITASWTFYALFKRHPMEMLLNTLFSRHTPAAVCADKFPNADRICYADIVHQMLSFDERERFQITCMYWLDKSYTTGVLRQRTAQSVLLHNI